MREVPLRTAVAGVIIPLYVDPNADWTNLASVAAQYPNVDFLVIVNPDNGTGVDSSASSYIAAIRAFPSNVYVLGYIYTGVQTTGLRPINGVAYTDTNRRPHLWPRGEHRSIRLSQDTPSTGYS